MPESILRRLGVRPTNERSFVLPDSRRVRKSVASAYIRLEGETHLNVVVFESDDAKPRLGSVTFATFGLAIDRVNQRLIPTDALLKNRV